MKLFLILNFLILIIFTISIKLLIINQENEIKILNKKLIKLEKEIEKEQTDFAYISSPNKLKEINEEEFNLKPILQENIIKLEN